MVFSWCSLPGFLGIIIHKYPLYIYIYKAYIGISYRGTLVGVHPTKGLGHIHGSHMFERLFNHIMIDDGLI